METTDAVMSLAALAQTTRLDIFRSLVQAGGDGLAAGEIAARLDLAGPTLSFHLAQLRHAGLVTCRRDGRSLFYAAAYDAVDALVAFLTAHCCRDAPRGEPPDCCRSTARCHTAEERSS